MKTIEVTDRTYVILEREAKCFEESIAEYLEDLIKDITEIIPTREEKREWKQKLFDALYFLATEREEFFPSKRDSLEALKNSYFYWASEYNDGYLGNVDKEDRYGLWLDQEFEKYI